MSKIVRWLLKKEEKTGLLSGDVSFDEAKGKDDMFIKVKKIRKNERRLRKKFSIHESKKIVIPILFSFLNQK